MNHTNHSSGKSKRASIRKKTEHYKAEERLWSGLLRNNCMLGYRFRRQCSVGPYIADFFCGALSLIIELDRIKYLEAGHPDTDLQKEDWLREHGFTLLRINGEEVLLNIENVSVTIEETIERIEKEKEIRWDDS